MSQRIITLFGEELQPEDMNAVGKSRAIAKPKPETPKPKPEKPEEKEAVVDTLVEEPAIAAELVVAETPPARIETPHKEPTKKKKEKSVGILEGWEPDKQFYSIGEVALLFKIATSHIRFWTNEFALKVRTTKKGDRLYSPEQIRELRTIYHLVKERGFTIAGAKTHLKSNKKIGNEAIDLKQSLLQLRNKLLMIKNQLK